MMAFRDLDEFLIVEPLVLPIRGKEYAFPGEVSARLWLQLQRLNEQYLDAKRAAAEGRDFEPDRELVSDGDQAAMMDELLGDAQAEMIADGLSGAHIKAAFYTCLAFHLMGRETAERVWNAQGEAPAPNRATRRKATAKSPRSRGSRAGTTSAKKKVPAPPGPTSSGTGT